MAHTETAKQKHQITNPHSKMRGHQNDIHLQSKTKESRKGSAAQRRVEGPGVSGGTPTEHKIVRPYDHVKGKKNFDYLGHMKKAEHVNRGHNLTPMQLPGITSMPLGGGPIGGGMPGPGLGRRRGRGGRGIGGGIPVPPVFGGGLG